MPHESGCGRATFVHHAALWTRFRNATGFAIIALLLAGCGSDTQKPTATPTPVAAATTAAPAGPTHASFIHKLDATCHGSSTDLQAAANAAGDDTDKLAAITTRFAGVLRRTVNRQAALQPPATDRRPFVSYLSAQRRLAGVFERLTTSLRADELDQARYLLSLIDGIREDRTRAALDLGLKRCGG